MKALRKADVVKSSSHGFEKPSSNGLAQAFCTSGSMISNVGHRWMIEFIRNFNK